MKLQSQMEPNHTTTSAPIGPLIPLPARMFQHLFFLGLPVVEKPLIYDKVTCHGHQYHLYTSL